jgi:hypothetical protein
MLLIVSNAHRTKLPRFFNIGASESGPILFRGRIRFAHRRRTLTLFDDLHGLNASLKPISLEANTRGRSRSEARDLIDSWALHVAFSASVAIAQQFAGPY